MKKTYVVKYTLYDGSEWNHENLEYEIDIEESELKNWAKSFAGVKDNWDEIFIDAIYEKDENGNLTWLNTDKYIDKSN